MAFLYHLIIPPYMGITLFYTLGGRDKAHSCTTLPCALRKLPEAFRLEDTKSWYTQYFNAEENLDYIGLIPDILYYGMDKMSGRESKETQVSTIP